MQVNEPSVLLHRELKLQLLAPGKAHSSMSAKEGLLELWTRISVNVFFSQNVADCFMSSVSWKAAQERREEKIREESGAGKVLAPNPFPTIFPCLFFCTAPNLNKRPKPSTTNEKGYDHHSRTSLVR